MLETHESSVVVTTTSSHVGANMTSDENDLRTQPRGFFADQFEVRCSFISLGPCSALRLRNIRETEMPPLMSLEQEQL